MKKYCKAYYLKDLRLFTAWKENNEHNEPELSDDDVVYVWDDFTVVKSPVMPNQSLLFDAVTPEWQNFCLTALNFALPENLQNASHLNTATAPEAPAREPSIASA